MDYLLNIWVLSELVVLLLNKKRRTLHDFIAGTVVLHLSAPAPDPGSVREGVLVKG